MPPKKRAATKKKTPTTKKTPKKVEQKTWPNWISVSGHASSGPDVYGRQQPGTQDLIAHFDDVAFCCASLLANTVASTPIKLLVKTEEGQARPKCQTRPVSRKTLEEVARRKRLGGKTTVEEVTDHPVLQLLNYGSPYHNGTELLRYTQLFQEIVGDSYWLLGKEYNGLPPTRLSLLMPQNMQPIRDQQGYIVGWKYGRGTDTIEYGLDEIIHFKFPSLQDPYGLGFSPLRAAWARVGISYKVIGFLDASLSNMGRPDCVWSPEGNEVLGPGEAQRFAKDYMHTFRTQGNGGLFISQHPGKLTPLGWPPRDFAELNLYSEVKTAICNSYGVPPDMLNLGQTNRSSAEAVLYALAVHAIKPRMELLCDKLNERLAPLYSDRLFFEASEVVPEDRQFLLQERQMLLSQGVITRAEARQLYGFDDAEWAEAPHLPPGVKHAPVEEEKPTEETANVIDQVQQPGGTEAGAADATNALRATVGGSQQIMAMQSAVIAGTLTREMAIANIQIVFGFSKEEAEALFPPTPTTTPEAPLRLSVKKKKKKCLEVPDVRQQGDFDCGAAAVCSVLNFFNIKATEEQCIQELGTTKEDGTSVDSIISYLGKVGLVAEGRNDLTIPDLGSYTSNGSPVIVCVQMYEDSAQQIPEEDSGHWVVVLCADDDQVTIQDPSAGRSQLSAYDFLARWQDKDSKTTKAQYIHFGIIVSKPTQPPEGTPKGPAAIHQAATDKAKTLTERVKEIPGKVYNKAKEKVKAKYAQLSERYGTAWAKTILAAGIIGTATPLPGGGLIAAAPLLACAELHLAFAGGKAEDGQDLSDEEVMKLGNDFINQLMEEWNNAISNETDDGGNASSEA